MSDLDRQREIEGLEALYNAEPAAEPSLPDIEPQSAIEPQYPTNETSSNPSRGKLRTYASEAGLFLVATSMTDKITTRLRDGRARREATYAVEEGDSRITRTRKFLGRNALRIAAGTMAGLGMTVAVGLRAKYGLEASSPLSGVDTADHFSSNLDISPAADTRYLVGGRLDDHGTALDAVMTNLKGHDAHQTVRVEYPADIAPAPGDKYTLAESSKIASDKLYTAYKNSNGKTIELIGYSEGTQGVQDAANRIAAENGGVLPSNVKVTLIATPNAHTTGAFNNELIQSSQPILEAFGIDTTRPIPQGAHVLAMDTDFWANSGNKPVTTQVSQLIGLAGDGHRAPEDGMRSTVRVIDGVTYETRYHNDGPQTAALRVLEQYTPIPVTEGMDKMGQALAPQGAVGEAVTLQLDDIVEASADLAKEGLNDRGITQADAIIDQTAASARQIAEAIQPTLEHAPSPTLNGSVDLSTAIPAPSTPAPAIPVAPVIAPEQITETATAANNFVDTIQPQLGLSAQENQLVDTIQSGVTDLINTLPKK